MALDKGALEAGIKGALAAVAGMEDGAGEARGLLAAKVAEAIHAYVLTADVNSGIRVQTTGSASAQTGSTTSTGSLS